MVQNTVPVNGLSDQRYTCQGIKTYGHYIEKSLANRKKV